MKRDYLETLILLAKRRGFKTHFYIDRLSVYFDARVSNDDLMQLKNCSPKNKLISPSTLEGYIHLSQKLELYQLDDDTLDLLKECCESNSAYKITYIELAMDLSNTSKLKVDTLRSFFNKHLVKIRKNSQIPPYFIDINDAHYYNDLSDSIRLVIYSDKPFRFNRKRFCVHLECRYKGLDALKTLEILIAKDVVDFDHQMYWEQRLDLRKPSFKAMGEYLGNSDVSDNALNKRGCKFFDKLHSLQELLSKSPEQIKLFPSMATDEALEKFLDRAFEKP